MHFLQGIRGGRARRLFGVLLVLLAFAAPAAAQTSTQRQVAVTFDDLPAVALSNDFAVHEEITRRLLARITEHAIPAIGFVNESKLFRNGQLESARVGLLKYWLDAGLDLGNHTYSHPSFFRTPLQEFQDNVLLGEQVTRPLAEGAGKRYLYFRHPFLNTGPDLETKQAFERFLKARGYVVAPVSIDNSDWLFARAYDNAAARGDTALMNRVVQAYVPYMERMFDYYERTSVALLGYELRQILLVHANRLNADHFDKVVEMIKRRGYTFISLDEALEDPAYEKEDRFVGPAGITWLQRWAITEGKKSAILPDEPVPPAFIEELAAIERP